MLYDEDCGFCRWSADRLRALDRRAHLRFASIQSEEGERLLETIPVRDRLDSWHAVAPDGRVHSSGAAVAEVLARLPGGAALAAITRASPRTTERAYRFVAHRRNRIAGWLGAEACRVDPRHPELERRQA